MGKGSGTPRLSAAGGGPKPGAPTRRPQNGPVSWDHTPPPTLFTGCHPAVLADCRGRVVAVDEDALERGRGSAVVVEVEGRAWPGLGDAHLHLHELVGLRLGLDLRSARSLEEAIQTVRAAGRSAPEGGWITGTGWNERNWTDHGVPTRQALDEAAPGRPVLLSSHDEHTVWASSRALEMAGITAELPDPADGIVERDPDGVPNGLVRECLRLFAGLVPAPGRDQYEQTLAEVLLELARLGLCSVHTMDPPETLFALQRLRERGRLPLRVVVNLPADQLDSAAELGLRGGWGDPLLRVFGVKAFLDGSLGSGTAEMLGGGGVARLSDAALDDLIRRCSAAELNPCLHAIGDGAVHRALVALERHAGAWPGWRPRIEHAQLVDPDDLPRFLRAGAVASMQPAHAPSDRRVADERWGDRTAHAYAWSWLAAAGVPLAFGSDAPVESPDPLLGLAAATSWRRTASWHPELALTEDQALAAYTAGVAYAAGLEGEQGRLLPGYRCDLTLVKDGRVVGTVIDGQLVDGG